MFTAKPKNLSKIDKEIEEIYRKQLLGNGGGKRFIRKRLQKMVKLIEEKYADIGLKVEIVTKRSHLPLHKVCDFTQRDLIFSNQNNPLFFE